MCSPGILSQMRAFRVLFLKARYAVSCCFPIPQWNIKKPHRNISETTRNHRKTQYLRKNQCLGIAVNGGNCHLQKPAILSTSFHLALSSQPQGHRKGNSGVRNLGVVLTPQVTVQLAVSLCFLPSGCWNTTGNIRTAPDCINSARLCMVFVSFLCLFSQQTASNLVDLTGKLQWNCNKLAL